ncbi:MAG: ABC transporter substrate-binding protein [Acidimicrobiales bacterium]
MRLTKLMAVPLLALSLLAACGDDDDDDTTAGSPSEEPAAEAGDDTGTVTVFSAMEPAEVDAVEAAIAEGMADAEYEVEIEASADFEEQAKIRIEGGNPNDVMLYPQPGAVVELARSGDAIALEDLGFDIGELEDRFGEYFVSLGEFEGKHYGMPSNINLKSMVWYPKDDFDAAGYEVPETWDDMTALADQIKADGGTPWCVGFESEAASGWPATDWMEDIMLRTAGTDVYDQWVTHEIPFDDESVQNAGEVFGQVMFGDGYVLGGADQTPAIAFGDAPGPMFEDPPGCWLHRQASFINAFFPEDAEAGVDYDWFPFPPIDQEGTLFAGEFAVTFRNAPEVVDFLERFSSDDVQCAQGGEVGSARLSPNIEVGPDCYANDILAASSEVVTTALAEDTGRFDASDQMPTEVGSGSFWTGMVAYMQGGPDSLTGVLDEIEASWPQ